MSWSLATQGFTGTATLGDNMAKIARLRGAVAVVTDGMVRDAAEIVDLGLPCFCRGITPNSAFPSGPGEVGLPLALGEVAVDAGDLVMGDRDGVVIVPARSALPLIAERLERVAALEAEMHAKVGRGEIRSLLDRWPGLPRPDHLRRVGVRIPQKNPRCPIAATGKFADLAAYATPNGQVSPLWFETTWPRPRWRGRTGGELFGSRFFRAFFHL